MSNSIDFRDSVFTDGISALIARAESERRPLTSDENEMAFEALDRIADGTDPKPAVLPMKSRLDQPGEGERRTEADLSGTITASLPAGRLRAFANTAAGRCAAFASGQFLRAVIGRDVNAADWCLDHGMDIRNALSGGDNSRGGSLVPEPMAQAIIDLRETYGVFRSNTRVIPMSSDTLLVPCRTGGVTAAAFIGENQQGSDSDKTWDNVQLTAKKLMALTLYSTELAEEAILSIGDDISSEMAYAFAEKEDDCGWNGTGISDYGGISDWSRSSKPIRASLAMSRHPPPMISLARSI